MKRRNIIRLISFGSVFVIALGVFAFTGVRDMSTYKNRLEVSYRQSLAELNECLDCVNTDLTKSLYSNSAKELKEISRDLYAQCSVAKNAVSRLPVSQMELGSTFRFLSQAGDYARYIESKTERGEAVTEKEHKNLNTLLKYSSDLSKQASEMVRLSEGGAKITDGDIKAEGTGASALSNSFSQSAKTFENFPTLLYDGPFSDQVLNKESELIIKSDSVTKNEAARIAAYAVDTSKNRLIYDGDSKGKLPAYTFKTGRYTVLVTKQGGFVKTILYSGAISENNISEKNAAALAKRYLERIGYANMKQSYYSVNNNICTVNFAYAKNGVYCYGDLIKVSVSMEDGKLIAVDAATYITNHRDRAAFSPKITQKQAQSRLSPYLTVNTVKESIIPKDSGKEVYCFEFFCTSRDTGEDALIYINTDTGDEEDILLLLYSDNGTLVK